jgi:hypothetical protein
MRNQRIVLSSVLVFLSTAELLSCSSENALPAVEAGGPDVATPAEAAGPGTGAADAAVLDTSAEADAGEPDASMLPDVEGPDTGSVDAAMPGTSFDAAADAGGPDAPVLGDAGGPDVTADATLLDGSAEAAIDATSQPAPRLLLSYNGESTSELVAFGLDSKAVDGRLVYPGFIGTTFVTPTSPWLLEQANDVVAQLDPLQPWVVQSSWGVALNDQTDSGFAASYSDPDGVVVGAGTKAYILRYTRNLIAVVDSSQGVDAGAPLKTIDLSGQVQAGGDGYVEMTAGWYDAANSRVYVLLANINRFDVGCGGYCQLCSNTSPTIVAIDTTTDTLVPLGGDAGNDAGVVTSGYVLQGYDPAFGPSPMVYDAPNNRLLVLESGCNAVESDGGTGPVVGREVAAISLTDGSTRQLLDLTSAAFPQAMFYIDAHHVILQLDTAYTWDPTTATLGPAIPNAPETFDVDGLGNLVGVAQSHGPDGGPSGFSVVSVSAGDGGVTTLGQNPFSLTNGFVGGAQLWPAP